MKMKNIKLQTRIIFLVILVVITSLMITGVLINRETTKSVKETQQNKAMDIALSIRDSEQVIDALKNDGEHNKVQSYTSEVQKSTHVDYIVVLDTDHKRRSHPVEKRIGQYFVGGDEDKAFEGERYTSTAQGTLGKSIRAFTPVWDGNRQIGVVSVGILLDKVEQEVLRSRQIIYIGIGIGGIIGLVGAILLARNIKHILHGLEPREIAQLFKEREAMLSSVREGIIAINKENEIVVANETAKNLFLQAGILQGLEGEKVDDLLSSSSLNQALHSQKETHDKEFHLNNIAIIVNIIPVFLKGELTGTVATFREKTELTHLAEQLTNVKSYAEILRAQTHEFMNKMHVILAMVQTESYEELSSYVDHLSSNYQREIGLVPQLIKDPVLAGYMMNKLAEIEAQNIEMTLAGDHPLPALDDSEMIEKLITMMSNLLDNARDAVAQCEQKKINLIINYQADQIHLTVEDNGVGMGKAEQNALFKKGMSTKGKHRGYGLYLLKQIIAQINGKLEVNSEKGKGSTFEVIIPYKTEENKHD